MLSETAGSCWPQICHSFRVPVQWQDFVTTWRSVVTLLQADLTGAVDAAALQPFSQEAYVFGGSVKIHTS